MNTDAHLFPPRSKWEADGYRPDEYSRWLKGDWRPIAELWAELGVKQLPECEWRCAQSPYDTLPIPRAEIPAGILLSRDGDAWVQEQQVKDVALPLYEGRMIGQFDFSQKGWVSGKGRTAVWRELPWEKKQIEPQFLMGLQSFQDDALKKHLDLTRAQCGNDAVDAEERRFADPNERATWWLRHGRRCGFMDISSATNTRTVIATNLVHLPCGNKVPCLATELYHVLPVFMSSFAFDYVMRRRMTALSLNYFILAESPLPRTELIASVFDFIVQLVLSTIMPASVFACEWLSRRTDQRLAWRTMWAITDAERLRRRVMADVAAGAALGIDESVLAVILKDCDHFSPTELTLDPKGFWRVDKDKDPELRHTVLTLVAFHDLQEKIRACGGDRERGIEAFLAQNGGEGWMFPETLRLADYGLGHDKRAKHPQPVVSRLGPRFYDWQLAQSAEESWRECHLHARNLLGEGAYKQLLADLDTERREERNRVTSRSLQRPTGKAPNKASSSSDRIAMLTSPFLTDLDSRAAVKGSRDPLGIQQIWTSRGFPSRLTDSNLASKSRVNASRLPDRSSASAGGRSLDSKGRACRRGISVVRAHVSHGV